MGTYDQLRAAVQRQLQQKFRPDPVDGLPVRHSSPLPHCVSTCIYHVQTTSMLARPEFLNRIDELLIFRALSEKEFKQIVPPACSGIP